MTSLALAALAAAAAWALVRSLLPAALARVARAAAGRDRPTPLEWAQALMFLAGAIRAGAALDDALRLLAERAPRALRRRIAATGWSGALSPSARVERMMAGDDTAFARAALLMFLESGGRIGRVLETAAATLQARGEAEERVRALTAQARASAWIVGLSPFALTGLMWFLSPDLMAPMFAGAVGRIVLAGGFALALAGLWLACRLARVEV